MFKADVKLKNVPLKCSVQYLKVFGVNMRLYKYLQYHMARFVLEMPKISEKDQYKISDKQSRKSQAPAKTVYDLNDKDYENISAEDIAKAIVEEIITKQVDATNIVLEHHDSNYCQRVRALITDYLANMPTSEPEALYLVLSIENYNKRDNLNFQTHAIPGSVLKRFKAFISTSSSKKRHSTPEEIAEQIFDAIKNNHIDPSKIILKGIDEGQTKQIRNLINNKLKNAKLGELPSSNPNYLFKPVCVGNFVSRAGDSQNDDAILDTLYVRPEKPSGNYIINCAARGRTYLDWIEDLNKDAQTSNATVIGFNYRGIGKSTGKLITQQDAVDDIIAQVKHLIQDEQVAPQKICLYGLCLGGAFAALAAAELKKENINVRLYLSRTFKRFDDTVIGLVLPRQYDKWPIYLLKLIFFPVLLIVSFAFKCYSKLMGWDINMAKAIKSIDAQNIEYDFAEPTKEDKSKGYTGDKIVLPENSPYQIIQNKLTAMARDKANDIRRNQRTEENLNAHQLLGLEVANLLEERNGWTEEESLNMLKELESVISELTNKLSQVDLISAEKPTMEHELKQFQAIHEGLSLVRSHSQTSHQVIRANPAERSWNPHACSPDKLKTYGYNGTLRDRLAWFINRTEPDCQQAPDEGFTLPGL